MATFEETLPFEFGPPFLDKPAYELLGERPFADADGGMTGREVGASLPARDVFANAWPWTRHKPSGARRAMPASAREFSEKPQLARCAVAAGPECGRTGPRRRYDVLSQAAFPAHVRHPPDFVHRAGP